MATASSRPAGPRYRAASRLSGAARFYAMLALPGILWLALLFIVPFYAVLAIAMGQLNRLYETPVAIYNPLHWSSANLTNVVRDLFGATAFAWPLMLRTI